MPQHKTELRSPLRRCLFCGLFEGDAQDASLLGNLGYRMCEPCFAHAGAVLAAIAAPKKKWTPADLCLSCGRGPFRRILVRGVAAAICQECRFRAAQKKMPIATTALQIARTKVVELDVARAAQIEARRLYWAMDPKVRRNNKRGTFPISWARMMAESIAIRGPRLHRLSVARKPGPHDARKPGLSTPGRSVGLSAK